MINYDFNILKEALATSKLVISFAEADLKCLAAPWAKDRFRHAQHRYKVEVALNGTPASLYFGVQESFPLSLPSIFLPDWAKFGMLPHVETDGYVCYAQEEGLVLDYENITGIIHEAISMAVQVIEDGISGKNKIDFLNEFGAYWDRLERSKSFISIVSPCNYVKKIYQIKNGGWYLSDDERSFKKFRKLPLNTSCKSQSAIYVPLSHGTTIIPPHPSKFWKLADVRKNVLDNLTYENKDKLFSLIKNYHHHEEVILMSLPLPNGHETLFGIMFKGVTRGHPLYEDGAAREIIPLSITRRDKEYLLPRGGSNLGLREKRVLLIGCGSLGGFIASELTRAGIAQLTVLDKDKLTNENVFRHVLGKKHIAQNKVDGIKEDIEGRLPYVEVDPVCSSLEEALDSGKIRISDFDLILSALGNVTIELAFNEMVLKTADAPPVIFCWLEPYGIGGHALLVNLNASSKGCLKCLYKPDEDDPQILVCRASFAEKGQVFVKNIDGCRNVFTPFGALDAIKTAELALRLAILTLNGHVKTNVLHSWRGDATEFLKNGKILSSRYYASKDNFIECVDYHRNKCSVCQ